MLTTARIGRIAWRRCEVAHVPFLVRVYFDRHADDRIVTSGSTVSTKHLLPVARAIVSALLLAILTAALPASAERTLDSGVAARARNAAIVSSRGWLARNGVRAQDVRLSAAWKLAASAHYR